MKRAIRWAAGLYPARWRERYGAEFSAMLDDLRPSRRDFFNILQGAFLMQVKFSSAAKIVAAVALAGLAVAGWFAIRTPDQFISTAVVQFRADDPDAAMDSLNQIQQRVFSRAALSQLIMKNDLYQSERRTEPLEGIVQNMRNRAVKVSIVSPAGKTDQPVSAFAVSFEYPDRNKAQAVTSDLTGMFIEQNIAIRSPATLAVLDAASLPAEPVAPRRSRILIMGLAGGLVLGILFLGVRRWPLVAACGVAAALLVWAGTLLVPNRFISAAVLITPDIDAARQVSQAVTDPAYLRSVIEKLNLYPDERSKQPIGDIVRQMRDRAVRAQLVELPTGSRLHGRRAIVITCTSEVSKFQAQAVTRELVAHSGARILDPPSLSEKPIWPNRAVITSLGLLGGILIGIAWAVVRSRRAPAPAY